MKPGENQGGKTEESSQSPVTRQVKATKTNEEDDLEIVDTARKISMEVKDMMLGVQEDWKPPQEKFAKDTSEINDRIGAALNEMEATLASVAKCDDRMVVVEGQVEELVRTGGRVGELERKVEVLEQELAETKRRPKPFDYERTLVLTNVAYNPTETKEERLDIATRILVEGFNIQHKDLPPIIDTARLPHNKETQIASLLTDRPYHPGIKVEFTDNHTRNLVLNQAKNLRRNENYKNVEARESMSPGRCLGEWGGHHILSL